jgi:glycosyltransferase involved in cell wall biosynthesis
MKKILIFSIAYYPFVGGAEVAIKELTDRLPGIQFDMVTLRFDRKLPRFERIGNVNIYRVGFGKDSPRMSDLVKFPLNLNKYFFPLTGFLKAQKLHKKNNYDVVWSMMANYAGFATLFFKIRNRGVPFLLTLQEGDPIEYIKKRVGLLYPLFKMIFKKADMIQSISTYLANFGRSMGYRGEVEIVPNGVDVSKFTINYPDLELNKLKSRLDKKPGDVFLVTTSRLVPKNGVFDVIKSLEFLPDNIKFLVLGDGPQMDSIKWFVKEKNLAERVKLLGYVDQKEILKYLKISDIFIRPSLSEGFGNSFIEAMAAGLPVIATPVGGIVDFLFDPIDNSEKEPTGVFCQPNDPKSITEAVEKILNNQELKTKIINNGRKLAIEKYDWNLLANEMRVKVFDNIIK